MSEEQKPKSAYKRLRPRQKKLVQGLVKGLSQPEAYMAAGYPVPRTEAQLVLNAHRAASRPAVVNALDEKIAEKYPDMESDIASGFKDILQRGPLGPNTPDGVPLKEWREIVMLAMAIRGWKAPEKSMRLSADVSKLKKLPGER